MVKLTVRARAVDMLGRQQIAGIPTAIHELFKNSHDAYAERAEIDYFRSRRLLVLRDDGYGMTREEVESRWLTLGTESRLNANLAGDESIYTGPKNLPRRPTMGEKGIGRLAIAAIAPLTLLLTRAVRPEGDHDLVVALVHWGLFEQPGLDISQIDIPIKEFRDGSLPNNSDIKDLVSRLLGNIEELHEDLEPKAFEKLKHEARSISAIDPSKIDSTLEEYRKEGEEPLSLKDNGYGTHFILLPTALELNDDIDGGIDNDTSAIQRLLLGFSNSMTGGVPRLKTEFRDHNLDQQPNELLGPVNFFLPEEFEKADHHFKGTFDEYGQFSGTVNIYGEEKPFICNWAEGRGRVTRCGLFSISYAYVMGLPKESNLDKNDHSEITEKLNRFGGIYIYKDGIRVLPYGNPDFDFLEIETRRGRSAQDWFFAYRRGFGHVTVGHENNPNLEEKAGREGFRQNLAYRDFRAVLINFFQRLALEFFRPTSPQGDIYWDIKKGFDAEVKLLNKQKKKADERRKEFKSILDNFFEAYESNVFEAGSAEIITNVRERLERISLVDSDEDLAIAVRDLELEAYSDIRNLEATANITKPRGLSLKGKLEKDWNAYSSPYETLKRNVFVPLRDEVDRVVNEVVGNRIGHTQRREIALESIEKSRDTIVKDISKLRRDAYSATEDMQKTLKAVVKEEFAEFREDLETHLTEFVRSSATSPKALDSARREFDNKLSVIRERETSLLDALRRQMEGLTESLKDRETFDDSTGALEQYNLRLEEQLDFYSDYSQMGMAVGILQHEFEKTAISMRTAMRDLVPYAKGTPKLNKIYRRLRESFDHLDGYLKALDPLGRRLNRQNVEITGSEIKNHLMRIFRSKLEQDFISLNASDEFLSKVVVCKSSSLLGAFVNVIDNAIYWVANGAKERKEINLDVDDEGFLISNSGPGIEERFKDRIFEFGETMKPGGRGMGLAVSKDTLQREGFELELIQSGRDVNPIFKIIKLEKLQEEEVDHG